jgi:hypothetical protein
MAAVNTKQRAWFKAELSERGLPASFKGLNGAYGTSAMSVHEEWEMNENFIQQIIDRLNLIKSPLLAKFRYSILTRFTQSTPSHRNRIIQA